METDRALYLFCFARAGPLPDFGGREVVVYPCGGLMAVCQWTGVNDWSGEQAEEWMHDLQWLAPRALRHQAVIESAMCVSPVLPAHLGTLFSSPEALELFVAAHRVTITDFLSEVENKQEWSFKALLDRVRAGAWLSSATETGPAAGGGASYLLARRARLAVAKELNRWAAQTVESIVDQLRCYAAQSRQRSCGATSAAGQPEPVLNLALLVSREKLGALRQRLEQAVREHGPHGLELSMSGPWPPYSFCPALEMPS
jgi:hypothetical protein